MCEVVRVDVIVGCVTLVVAADEDATGVDGAAVADGTRVYWFPP